MPNNLWEVILGREQNQATVADIERNNGSASAYTAEDVRHRVESFCGLQNPAGITTHNTSEESSSNLRKPTAYPPAPANNRYWSEHERSTPAAQSNNPTRRSGDRAPGGISPGSVRAMSPPHYSRCNHYYARSIFY
ncbi:feS assembly ATPase SufC [Anopheles sinensis]|uniref:FeS assembly ATPase SufC n=1 Tax=Anopheles sinensis TaxID=74873 RepID=A0A084VQ56_ANOSI|nr:feS assembly ATPase SufC [Anopheles sinensis]